MKSHRWFLTLAVLSLVVVSAVMAQTFVGGVRGLILDPNGAAVPAVNVTLLNEATGTTRSTISNGTGEYVFNQVAPATYTLSAEVSGFKKLERKGVVIGTQENISVDLKMELGQVSESVQVTTEVPLIRERDSIQRPGAQYPTD